MKLYGGERGVSPLILNLSIGWVWSTSRASRFSPRKKNQYVLNRRLGGPHWGSGSFGEEKNISHLRSVSLTLLLRTEY
jgi:hypothetical protein